MTGISKYIPVEFNYPNVCFLDTIVQTWIYEVQPYGKLKLDYTFIDEDNDPMELLEYWTPDQNKKLTMNPMVSHK